MLYMISQSRSMGLDRGKWDKVSTDFYFEVIYKDTLAWLSRWEVNQVINYYFKHKPTYYQYFKYIFDI